VSRGSLRIVVCGLSLTSSWGNGHATTYRALLRELTRRGHDVLFLERDAPWYQENRDLAECDFCDLQLYSSIRELKALFTGEVRRADVVIVGSYVPEGVAVGNWAVHNSGGIAAFYDIDTPVTLSDLKAGKCEYLSRDLVPKYDLYLSFTGGPTLRHIEQDLGSPLARLLACSVDPNLYYQEANCPIKWDLGYLGTYSTDRQPKLKSFLIDAALRFPDRRFTVAGSLYPDAIEWPSNVMRVNHIPPAEHRSFYNRQKFTLNLTRQDMVAAGYSPSVRLFEAAACGTAIISDYWPGLEEFFQPGKEILLATDTEDCCKIITAFSEDERRLLGERAQRRVLSAHTSTHRALELELYIRAALEIRTKRRLVPIGRLREAHV
jgi:spore maturation protein CgeB